MRLAALVFVLGFALGARAEGLSARSPADGPTVFKLRAFDASGRVRLGSGVLVAPERLVTNAHVIGDAVRVEVTAPGRSGAVAEQSCNRRRDLCLLRVPGLGGTVAPLRLASNLAPGEAVFAAGYPAGGRLVRNGGEVKALHAFDMSKVIQSSAEFDAGASGGGLFDREGRLVGVITFKWRHGGDFHFAVPAEWVAAALDGGPESGAPVATGRAFWDEDGERMPLFLRAAALEAGGNWEGLLDLATDWRDAETHSPGPWRAAAMAYEGLGRAQDAALARAREQSLSAPDGR